MKSHLWGQRQDSSQLLFPSNGIFCSYLKPALHGYVFLTDTHFDPLCKKKAAHVAFILLFMGDLIVEICVQVLPPSDERCCWHGINVGLPSAGKNCWNLHAEFCGFGPIDDYHCRRETSKRGGGKEWEGERERGRQMSMCGCLSCVPS